MTRAEFCDFWLAPTRGSAAALFRVCYGVIAIWTATGVLLNLERYYTDAGLLPWSSVQDFPEQAVSLFSLAPHSGALAWSLAATFLIAAATFTLGVAPRASALAIFVVNVSLQHRNPYVVNAGDRLFLIFALLATLLPLDRRWSRARGAPIVPARIFGQRLIALQVAYVYLHSFIAKIDEPHWQDGTALYDILASPVLAEWPMHIELAPLIRLLTWSTLLFELSFPLLVWNPRFRPYLLASGVLFHLGIEITLTIPIFSAIMIASYTCFLSDDEAERLLNWLARPFSKLEPRTTA